MITPDPPNIHELIPPRTLAILTELIRRVKARGYGEVRIVIKAGRVQFIGEGYTYNVDRDIALEEV